MRNDYFDDLVPSVPSTSPLHRGRKKQRDKKPVPSVPAVPTEYNDDLGVADDLPLAAKLRALGCPIAFEVDGEVVFWLVADDEAAQRANVDGAVFTAAEAETLAQFDAVGIRELAKLKAAFGGTLEPDNEPDR